MPKCSKEFGLKCHAVLTHMLNSLPVFSVSCQYNPFFNHLYTMNTICSGQINSLGSPSLPIACKITFTTTTGQVKPHQNRKLGVFQRFYHMQWWTDYSFSASAMTNRWSWISDDRPHRSLAEEGGFFWGGEEWIWYDIGQLGALLSGCHAVIDGWMIPSAAQTVPLLLYGLATQEIAPLSGRSGLPSNNAF